MQAKRRRNFTCWIQALSSVWWARVHGMSPFLRAVRVLNFSFIHRFLVCIQNLVYMSTTPKVSAPEKNMVKRKTRRTTIIKISLLNLTFTEIFMTDRKRGSADAEFLLNWFVGRKEKVNEWMRFRDDREKIDKHIRELSWYDMIIPTYLISRFA